MAKTIEEIVDSLFGDAETMTKAQLVEAVGTKGMKLADLSDGDFVMKQKYDDHVAKYKKLQSDYDALKANPSDSEQYKALEKERDDWKSKFEKQDAESTKAHRMAFLTDSKVKPEFRNFLLSEIASNVTDAVDFETAAKKYLADNKQYIESVQPSPSGLPINGNNSSSDDLWSDLEAKIRG